MKKMYFDNKKIEEKITTYQQNKDPQILNELTPDFEKLILGVIGKYKLLRSNFINDDLFQEAWVGILEVIPKWSKEKGDIFSYLTAVVKNKIFWYLKNQYQDTSYVSNDLLQVEIDEDSVFMNEKIDNFDLISIKDYVKKIEIENLNIGLDDEKPGKDKDFAITLSSIKEKILSGDNIEYREMIKEIQKETLIPKKKIKAVLDAMYRNFIGE
jgi:DNA-directed RNA polymerase specialized sigma subunit